MSLDSSFLFELKNADLPSSFEHIIVDEKSSETEFHIRSNIKNMKEIQQWITEFSLKTKTQWNSRLSVPNGKQMACMKQFVCHHAAFMKVDQNLNSYGPAASKNASCTAKIIIKIKLTTKDTAKRDPFVKKNLPAIIRISKQHTHELGTAQAYRFLQDRDQILRKKFIAYFDDRMTAAQAKIYHERILKEMDSTEADLATGFINPSKKTISYWYSKWREENLKNSLTKDNKSDEQSNNKIEETNSTAHTESETNDDIEVYYIDDILVEESEASDDIEAYNVDDILRKESETNDDIEPYNVDEILRKATSICNLLFTKIDTYHSSATRNSIDIFHERLEKINSEESLELFLCSANFCIPHRPKNGAKISVQATSIACQRPGIKRGATKTAAGRPHKSGNGCSKKKKIKCVTAKISNSLK